MGFDDNSDSEQELDPEQNVRKRNVQGGNEHRTGESRKSMQEHLLDGLPLWLDRLFEGSTQRYYINYWPEFPVYGKRHMHDEWFYQSWNKTDQFPISIFKDVQFLKPETPKSASADFLHINNLNQNCFIQWY